MAPAKEPFKTPKSRGSVKATPQSGPKNQRSILGFFQKSSPVTPAATAATTTAAAPTPTPTITATALRSSQDAPPASSPIKKVSARNLTKQAARLSLGNVTPVPSSDPVGPDDEDADDNVNNVPQEDEKAESGTPSRRVCCRDTHKLLVSKC